LLNWSASWRITIYRNKTLLAFFNTLLANFGERTQKDIRLVGETDGKKQKEVLAIVMATS